MANLLTAISVAIAGAIVVLVVLAILARAAALRRERDDYEHFHRFISHGDD